jgi:hypothetical protein
MFWKTGLPPGLSCLGGGARARRGPAETLRDGRSEMTGQCAAASPATAPHSGETELVVDFTTAVPPRTSDRRADRRSCRRSDDV